MPLQSTGRRRLADYRSTERPSWWDPSAAATRYVPATPPGTFARVDDTGLRRVLGDPKESPASSTAPLRDAAQESSTGRPAPLSAADSRFRSCDAGATNTSRRLSPCP